MTTDTTLTTAEMIGALLGNNRRCITHAGSSLESLAYVMGAYMENCVVGREIYRYTFPDGSAIWHDRTRNEWQLTVHTPRQYL